MTRPALKFMFLFVTLLLIFDLVTFFINIPEQLVPILAFTDFLRLTYFDSENLVLVVSLVLAYRLYLKVAKPHVT